MCCGFRRGNRGRRLGIRGWKSEYHGMGRGGDGLAGIIRGAKQAIDGRRVCLRGRGASWENHLARRCGENRACLLLASGETLRGEAVRCARGDFHHRESRRTSRTTALAITPATTAWHAFHARGRISYASSSRGPIGMFQRRQYGRAVTPAGSFRTGVGVSPGCIIRTNDSLALSGGMAESILGILGLVSHIKTHGRSSQLTDQGIVLL